MRTFRHGLTTLLPLLTLGAALLFATSVFAAPPQQSYDPVVIVNTAYLNQRTGPGPEYAVQGVHAGGAVLPVIGRTEDRSWWEVQTQFGAGWVNNEYVLTQGNFRGVPVVTEYGILDRPQAIIFGLPVTVYARPNPGAIGLGQAPTNAAYPVHGQSYHPGTETWFFLVQTEVGLGWLAETGAALYGFTDQIPTLTTEAAFALPIGGIPPNGIVNPPPETPVPSAPTAPPTAPPPAAVPPVAAAPPAAGDAAAVAAAPAVVPPTQIYQLRFAGECDALALVNFLIQTSPMTATDLECTTAAYGIDLVLLQRAEVAMVVDEGCGGATARPVATLTYGDGSTHTLHFCILAAPNSATQSFLNWVYSPAGSAAIQAYRGLVGSTVPVSAAPAW